jgi:hypothetical protein
MNVRLWAAPWQTQGSDKGARQSLVLRAGGHLLSAGAHLKAAVPLTTSGRRSVYNLAARATTLVDRNRLFM